MKKIILLLFISISTVSFAQVVDKKANAKEIENAISTLAQYLKLNPENPLKIDNNFLSNISQLIDDETVKSTLQSYSTNLGKDGDLSYRQIYWDLTNAFEQYPAIANNSQYQEMRQGLSLMFENYGLLSNKLKGMNGNYEFGTFINDPALINGLTTITGSYEHAQAIGMGVELAVIFTEAFTAGKKFKDDYMKLASLSTKNAYAETDVNLTSALIDSYVGIEAFQVITPMYRYDFNNGASLRVENGILKYFNSKKGIVKNLMVVDKRHDGNLYKPKQIRGLTISSFGRSTIEISSDEKVIYLFVNPEAISDVKCAACLEKSGYTINSDNGEIIYTSLGTKLGWAMAPTGESLIEFNENNIPIGFGFAASQGIFNISRFPFVSDEMYTKRMGMVTLLDGNKKFMINGLEREFQNSGTKSVFDHVKSQFFYLFEKDGGFISLVWANSLSDGLLVAGDGTSYSSSMIQISKSKDNKTADYLNADGMINELTGLAMMKSGDLYFAGKNGNIGKLKGSEYKLDDPLFPSKIRKAMDKKVFSSHNYIANKSYISSHGQINSPNERYRFYPRLKFTPDEKILIYTENDNFYIINPENFNNVKHFKLTFYPYNYYFTKENGDWVINFQSLNEFKFPITKKYSINKLISAFDLNKHSINKQENNIHNSADNTNFSLADEIKKLKELLDQGVITQEEFTAAKSKLLNAPKETTKPASGSSTTKKNDDTDYSDWLFIKSDQALQVRYKLNKQIGEIGHYNVQFRINFEDEIFCKSETCKGYILTFGYPDLDGIKSIYSHYKFYNTYKGIYTVPYLIPIKTSFSDGSKRFLTKQGFYYTPKSTSINSTKEIPANLFSNCVDIITTREPISKSNCVSWKKMFIEAEAETLK